MPTFTAVALDRLIEQRNSKSMAAGKNIPNPKLERRNSTPNAQQDRGVGDPHTKHARSSSTTTLDKKHSWARISPALYATPESTPLPDSPSSFPPSPYIVNHKRRGPRLLKSASKDDVAISQQALDEEKAAETAKSVDNKVVDSGKDVGLTNSIPSAVKEQHANVVHDEEPGSTVSCNGLAGQDSSMKSVKFSMGRDGETDDFFDPQDSVSVKSNTEGENNIVMERSLNPTTPVAEFYDAWEELSSESGPQPSPFDIEAELREIRLSLLMEIEQRKQAEEALNNMRNQWLRIREQLSLVGLTLHRDPVAAVEEEQIDPAEDLCRQVNLARFVSNSVGRGTAKAEVEVEMEAQLESKNFEITRLLDRLHYYEAVNREMSQRNQETVETMRRLRQRRKRRQRWVWASIAAAVTLGSATLAWSYHPTGKGSSSTNSSLASKGDHLTQ